MPTNSFDQGMWCWKDICRVKAVPWRISILLTMGKQWVFLSTEKNIINYYQSKWNIWKCEQLSIAGIISLISKFWMKNKYLFLSKWHLSDNNTVHLTFFWTFFFRKGHKGHREYLFQISNWQTTCTSLNQVEMNSLLFALSLKFFLILILKSRLYLLF